MEPIHPTSPGNPDRATFPSTCWSRILVAGDPTRKRDAVATLAREYRSAVAAYLRAACSLPADRAEDCAQDFFAHVLESGWLERADPRRGGFRSFLKQSLRNFAADAARRDRAEKRGAGRIVGSGGDGFDPLAVADVRTLDPDAELDRRFRRTLVERALSEVKDELAAKGRARQFEAFSAYFLNDADIDYRAIGERLELTPAEVSNALQRTKALFRERLRARVVETVADGDELEAELAWLFGKERA